MYFELKEMLMPVFLWLNCYNFRGFRFKVWPASVWEASPEQDTPALAEHLYVKAWTLRAFFPYRAVILR